MKSSSFILIKAYNCNDELLGQKQQLDWAGTIIYQYCFLLPVWYRTWWSVVWVSCYVFSGNRSPACPQNRSSSHTSFKVFFVCKSAGFLKILVCVCERERQGANLNPPQFPLFSCRTSWNGHRLRAWRSIGLNWWSIVPPQSSCLRQSVMHSCKIETDWKWNNGCFSFLCVEKAGLGLKALRKEDEEKNTFPVPLRRTDGLGLMTSPGFIMNELVQHGGWRRGMQLNLKCWHKLAK